MSAKKKIEKGYALEETLRAYFLRAGFFVVRGAPFQFKGEDLTDIDLWLYERPTGTARRRQIVDAKSKTRPKAVERLLWTKGLAEALHVDGAYIATTDTRASLREISKRLGLSLLDGHDIKRIQESSKVAMPERLTDEDLSDLIKAVDKSHRTKEFQTRLLDIKGSVTESFGVASVNRALDAFLFFAQSAVTAHADSASARLAGRLSYFCASIASISLDFIGMELPFQTADERHEMFTNAVRYGASNRQAGLEKLRLALGIVRQYADNGPGTARKIEQGFTEDLDSIPAEIIADQAVRMSKDGSLFNVGKDLEIACHLRSCPPFDSLDSSSKSLLGAFLDYCSVDRKIFAHSWKADCTDGHSDPVSGSKAAKKSESDDGPLFE